MIRSSTGTGPAGRGRDSRPGCAPTANNQCGVSSITGTSADNITAEGGAIIDTGSSDVAESVAFHFNGTSWSQMTIPANVTLGPLAAFSATDLWSVNNNGDAEQFNGSTWTTTKLPITTTLPDLDMTSISGSSPSDIWAAGTASTSGVERRKVAPVLEHFNGTSWTNVTVPVTGGVGERGGHQPHRCICSRRRLAHSVEREHLERSDRDHADRRGRVRRGSRRLVTD